MQEWRSRYWSLSKEAAAWGPVCSRTVTKDGALPTEMRALVVDRYGPPPYPLRVAERETPRPGPGDVVVRVAASPANPSDLAFLEGNYAFRRALPAIPGLEASGRVVAAGSGFLSRRLLGKRVACVSKADHGAWAQYTLAAATQCFTLADAIDDEHGAMGVVNPLAALGLIERVSALRTPAFVSTAAAGALGRMLGRLARRRNLVVIDVVRRREHLELLRSQGAQHVVDSSEPDFDERLKELVVRLDARVALDAIGGDMTRSLLQVLPHGGRVILYGGLASQATAPQPSLARPDDVIFGDKRVEGFYIPNWIARKSLPQLLMLQRRWSSLLGSDLATEIRARVALEDAPDAIAGYTRAMTGGKVLIFPNGTPR